ncbi:hypothetical protein ACFL5H_03690 [Candidatus Latescibacterota bacterium]
MMTDITSRDIFSNAIQYWEKRRIIYNALLLVVVLIVFFQSWPESRTALSFDTVQILFVCAVLANVFYCSAYIVDCFVQYSEFRITWLRFRWVLYVTGVLFAIVLTNSISQDIFHIQPQ